MKISGRLTIICTVLLLTGVFAYSQDKDKDIPISESLRQNSEKWLIKIGMINGKKPPKVKFGPYVTENRRGPETTTDRTRLIGPSADKSTQLKFALDVIPRKTDSAYVEASVETSKDSLRDVSVYMSTNLKPDELWVLILKEPAGTGIMSLSDMVLTNGDEDIEISPTIGDPTGKSEYTAPKGITLMQEGLILGSMQYYSGGNFAYKKYIWINNSTESHLQLITAAVFASIMETAGYFETVTLEE